MNIVIAGGTGLIGRRLTQRLARDGHSVTVLSRSEGRIDPRAQCEPWNGRDAGAWTRAVDASDVVVNLAGASLAGGRWTPRRKLLLRNSRLDATRAIVDSLRRAPQRPRVLVNASAVGYYGPVDEGDVTEDWPAGSDFLAGLCREWESEAMRARETGTRVALIRTGMVLDRSGGALARLVLPFRFFVGGPLGTGRQWLPWVHHDDVVGAIIHLMASPGLDGPYNVMAPEVVRMDAFCATLGRVLRRPSWMPVPSFALRLLLGEMAGVVLTGQRAVPDRLTASGYRFRYPELEGALREVMGR